MYKTKGQYEKAFIYTELDNGDLGYFIQYNLEALQKSFDDLKEYLSRKQEEENSILEFMVTDGINERQARIIKLYKDKPNSIYTAKELVSFLGVTEKTVRTGGSEAGPGLYAPLLQIPVYPGHRVHPGVCRVHRGGGHLPPDAGGRLYRPHAGERLPGLQRSGPGHQTAGLYHGGGRHCRLLL